MPELFLRRRFAWTLTSRLGLSSAQPVVCPACGGVRFLGGLHLPSLLRPEKSEQPEAAGKEGQRPG
jgi:hypothetical protein